MQCSPIIPRLSSRRAGFPASGDSEQQTVKMSDDYRHMAMVDGADFQRIL
jgi:hypothetical protein